jgi:hypothetical protein
LADIANTGRTGLDWDGLTGQTIEIWSNGIFIRRGEVEVVTADASILWIRPYGVHGRQMIGRSDSYEVKVAAKPHANAIAPTLTEDPYHAPGA